MKHKNKDRIKSDKNALRRDNKENEEKKGGNAEERRHELRRERM